jgi:hypothetical protein
MRCPEDACFPSCLRSCLEYLGEGLGCRQIGTARRDCGTFCGYSYLMGTTGAAFRLNWKPGWHEDNVATYLVSDDPTEIFRRGLHSAGRDCDILCKERLQQQGEDVEAVFRQRIVQSIRDKGRPVIAHGVVGPPEECIITGYDEGGDVLLGWSFFQHDLSYNAGVEFEPCGYFRKRDWIKDTHGLVVIGDRLEHQPHRELVFCDALAFALDVARVPLRYGDRHNGLAAYDAWAEHLLRDEDFPANDPDILMQRFAVHDDAVSTIAEGRWYASVFLAQAATCDLGVSTPHLYKAAACYATEHDLMQKAWAQVGGLGRSPAKASNLADPFVRRGIVPLIREARAKDEEAAVQLERALGKY